MYDDDEYDRGYLSAIEDFKYRLDELENKYEALSNLIAARDRVYNSSARDTQQETTNVSEPVSNEKES